METPSMSLDPLHKYASISVTKFLNYRKEVTLGIYLRILPASTLHVRNITWKISNRLAAGVVKGVCVLGSVGQDVERMLAVA